MEADGERSHGRRGSLPVSVASISRLLSLNWTAPDTILLRLVEYLVGLHEEWGASELLVASVTKHAWP